MGRTFCFLILIVIISQLSGGSDGLPQKKSAGAAAALPQKGRRSGGRGDELIYYYYDDDNNDDDPQDGPHSKKLTEPPPPTPPPEVVDYEVEDEEPIVSKNKFAHSQKKMGQKSRTSSSPIINRQKKKNRQQPPPAIQFVLVDEEQGEEGGQQQQNRKKLNQKNFNQLQNQQNKFSNNFHTNDFQSLNNYGNLQHSKVVIKPVIGPYDSPLCDPINDPNDDDDDLEILHQIQPECQVTQWTDWSPCTATCDQPQGTQTRERRYSGPNSAARFGCRRRLCDRAECRVDFKICNHQSQSLIACQTTDWTPWSPCSASCGQGQRSRQRKFLVPQQSQRCNNNVEVEEREICFGPGPPDCARVAEEAAHACDTTDWSQWGPCNVTCGRGSRHRTRQYVNSRTSSQYHCQLDLTQIDSCHKVGPLCGHLGGLKEICKLSKHVGHCPNDGGWGPRWFFDSGKMRCQQFLFHPCEGANQNNFLTQSDCQATCNVFKENFILSPQPHHHGHHGMTQTDRGTTSTSTTTSTTTTTTERVTTDTDMNETGQEEENGQSQNYFPQNFDKEQAHPMTIRGPSNNFYQKFHDHQEQQASRYEEVNPQWAGKYFQNPVDNPMVHLNQRLHHQHQQQQKQQQESMAADESVALENHQNGQKNHINNIIRNWESKMGTNQNDDDDQPGLNQHWIHGQTPAHEMEGESEQNSMTILQLPNAIDPPLRKANKRKQHRRRPRPQPSPPSPSPLLIDSKDHHQLTPRPKLEKISTIRISQGVSKIRVHSPVYKGDKSKAKQRSKATKVTTTTTTMKPPIFENQHSPSPHQNPMESSDKENYFSGQRTSNHPLADPMRRDQNMLNQMGAMSQWTQEEDEDEGRRSQFLMAQHQLQQQFNPSIQSWDGQSKGQSFPFGSASNDGENEEERESSEEKDEDGGGEGAFQPFKNQMAGPPPKHLNQNLKSLPQFGQPDDTERMEGSWPSMSLNAAAMVRHHHQSIQNEGPQFQQQQQPWHDQKMKQNEQFAPNLGNENFNQFQIQEQGTPQKQQSVNQNEGANRKFFHTRPAQLPLNETHLSNYQLPHTRPHNLLRRPQSDFEPDQNGQDGPAQFEPSFQSVPKETGQRRRAGVSKKPKSRRRRPHKSQLKKNKKIQNNQPSSDSQVEEEETNESIKKFRPQEVGRPWMQQINENQPPQETIQIINTRRTQQFRPSVVMETPAMTLRQSFNGDESNFESFRPHRPPSRIPQEEEEERILVHQKFDGRNQGPHRPHAASTSQLFKDLEPMDEKDEAVEEKQEDSKEETAGPSEEEKEEKPQLEEIKGQEEGDEDTPNLDRGQSQFEEDSRRKVIGQNQRFQSPPKNPVKGQDLMIIPSGSGEEEANVKNIQWRFHDPNPRQGGQGQFQSEKFPSSSDPSGDRKSFQATGAGMSLNEPPFVSSPIINNGMKFMAGENLLPPQEMGQEINEQFQNTKSHSSTPPATRLPSNFQNIPPKNQFEMNRPLATDQQMEMMQQQQLLAMQNAMQNGFGQIGSPFGLLNENRPPHYLYPQFMSPMTPMMMSSPFGGQMYHQQAQRMRDDGGRQPDENGPSMMETQFGQQFIQSRPPPPFDGGHHAKQVSQMPEYEGSGFPFSSLSQEQIQMMATTENPHALQEFRLAEKRRVEQAKLRAASLFQSEPDPRGTHVTQSTTTTTTTSRPPMEMKGSDEELDHSEEEDEEKNEPQQRPPLLGQQNVDNDGRRPQFMSIEKEPEDPSKSFSVPASMEQEQSGPVPPSQFGSPPSQIHQNYGQDNFGHATMRLSPTQLKLVARQRFMAANQNVKNRQPDHNPADDDKQNFHHIIKPLQLPTKSIRPSHHDHDHDDEMRDTDEIWERSKFIPSSPTMTLKNLEQPSDFVPWRENSLNNSSLQGQQERRPDQIESSPIIDSVEVENKKVTSLPTQEKEEEEGVQPSSKEMEANEEEGDETETESGSSEEEEEEEEDDGETEQSKEKEEIESKEEVGQQVKLNQQFGGGRLKEDEEKDRKLAHSSLQEDEMMRLHQFQQSRGNPNYPPTNGHLYQNIQMTTLQSSSPPPPPQPQPHHGNSPSSEQASPLSSVDHSGLSNQIKFSQHSTKNDKEFTQQQEEELGSKLQYKNKAENEGGGGGGVGVEENIFQKNYFWPPHGQPPSEEDKIGQKQFIQLPPPPPRDSPITMRENPKLTSSSRLPPQTNQQFDTHKNVKIQTFPPPPMMQFPFQIPPLPMNNQSVLDEKIQKRNGGGASIPKTQSMAPVAFSYAVEKIPEPHHHQNGPVQSMVEEGQKSWRQRLNNPQAEQMLSRRPPTVRPEPIINMNKMQVVQATTFRPTNPTNLKWILGPSPSSVSQQYEKVKDNRPKSNDGRRGEGAEPTKNGGRQKRESDESRTEQKVVRVYPQSSNQSIIKMSSSTPIEKPHLVYPAGRVMMTRSTSGPPPAVGDRRPLFGTSKNNKEPINLQQKLNPQPTSSSASSQQEEDEQEEENSEESSEEVRMRTHPKIQFKRRMAQSLLREKLAKILAKNESILKATKKYSRRPTQLQKSGRLKKNHSKTFHPTTKITSKILISDDDQPGGHEKAPQRRTRSQSRQKSSRRSNSNRN